MIHPSKLGKAIDSVRMYFINSGVSDETKAGCFLALSYLLQALGLKRPEEPFRAAMERLLANEDQYSLLNDSHRQILARMIEEMMEPLGVKDSFIVGISEEGKPFVTSFCDETKQRLDPNQIRDVLRAIADSKEDMDWTL